jgi:hypothetical protein
MRARFRSTKSMQRRVLPERPRLTVQRTVTALKRTREALVDLESHLGDILQRLRTPGATLDRVAGEQLAGAKSDAVAAMAGLEQVGHLFG